MTFLVGVDGGGTKTLAVAENLQTGQRTRGQSGPSNLYSVGFEAACLSIEQAVAEAVSDMVEIDAICLGLAGVAREEESLRFLDWARQHYPQARILVLNDAELTLASAAREGAAIALVCGTGSVVFGRTTQTIVRAGGWGYLFGDEGSGFSIGVAALRAVMQAYDGRAGHTLLTGLILQARQCAHPEELIASIYGHSSPRTVIASLAPLVEDAAQAGDPVALAILEQAAEDLVRMAETVYHKIGSQPVPLGMSGGVILNGPMLKQKFFSLCQERGLEWQTIVSIAEPAMGALALAKQVFLERK